MIQRSSGNMVIIAQITQIEIVSGAARRVREGTLTTRTARAVRRLIDRHARREYEEIQTLFLPMISALVMPEEQGAGFAAEVIIRREAMMCLQARLAWGHPGKKGPAAHHHQLAPGTGDGHIETVGMIQEGAVEVVRVRSGQ
jgi:hypothetical protein